MDPSAPALPEIADPVSPPPPPASARFPDVPPSARRAAATGPARRPGGSPVPGETVPETTARLRPAGDSRRLAAPRETPAETTTRLRPIRSAPPSTPAAAESRTGEDTGAPAAAARTAPRRPEPAPARPTWSPAPPPAAPTAPDPALSWSAGSAARPYVSFAEPEAFAERRRPRIRPRTAAAAACLVLGLGLIGGAVTGTWLTGDGTEDATGDTYTSAGTLWHSVPVDQLFPRTVEGTGAGPGGADRTWTRVAVAPDSGCAQAFDPLLRKVLAPVGCRRLLRATYTDATQSYVTTVGLLFTKADPAAMSALARRFDDERLDRRNDLIPRPYAAKGTVAAHFGDAQRASWTVSVVTDAPVVAFAVSGWADGRTVDSPQPAAEAARSGATTAPAQAGLGNEAQGLADRIERRLRRTIGTATEKPS
ncbi:hypothetical protein [Streptomyces sp. PanSC9]|uniref:hypothetical protein n=1 Tax=Streptomyces sp. PanSC9 TaxID=1520461 RepID=UPI000FB0EE52|nr:hypothetical protein [Streptomyces sp. PanSC9]ROP54323.1 hypothetical protein EDD94_3848 [Streptomyces sp. PanSC9]